MQRREYVRQAHLEVQTLHSITVRAHLANVKRQLSRRLLPSSGVQLVHVGRPAVVPMSEIENRIPLLRESLCTDERARGLVEVVAALRKNGASTR
jgi:hypothetical protein